MIVTNVVAEGAIASALRAFAKNEVSIADVLLTARTAGKGRAGTQIQALINEVLGRSDDQLSTLLSRVELVENVSWPEARAIIANGFAIDPGVDQQVVVQGLLGWMTETLVTAWRNGEVGMISRTACLKQVHAITRQLVRQRLLPRPAADVTVSEVEHRAAQTRDFVARLVEVRADDETIFEAVEHFLRFSAERYRLAAEGEIPAREWVDRGNRLKQRWRGVARQTVIEEVGRSEDELGRLILARTTFSHYEPIGQDPCNELYMTSGHYHRLADDSDVWWTPSRPRHGDAS
ncbi:ABC-three component system protein [Devosia soli]|nr:ABC-three component system protein [Devosia soli]